MSTPQQAGPLLAVYSNQVCRRCLTSAASGRNDVSCAAASCPPPSSSDASVTTSSKPHIFNSFNKPCLAPADRGPLPLPLLLLLMLGPCVRGGGGGTSTSCTRSNSGPSEVVEPALSSSLSLNDPAQRQARIGKMSAGQVQCRMRMVCAHLPHTGCDVWLG